jgi:hypothetical protein
MASLYKELLVDVPADRVWDAVRDVGALHTRLVPGFVADTKLEGDVRVVTFGNGMVMREPIISIDDARRRLAWAATGGHIIHCSAVLQVFGDGDGARIVWTTDLLPHGLAADLDALQDQALAIMKKTLERRA